MATITSLGVGSGIDAESLVSKLMTVEKQPLTALQARETKTQEKISAYGSISSLLGTLNDKLSVMKSTSSLKALTATSSNTDALTASATSSATAGSYDIAVTTLAKPSKAKVSVSDGNSATNGSSEVMGAGSLALTLGSNSPVTINLTSSTATLGDWRDAINNAGAGVKATILNTSTGAVLSLTTDENGQSLTLDTSSAPSPIASGTQTSTAGTLATFTIDGVAFTTDTNTTSSTIPGLTLNLLKANTSSTVEVATSNDTLKTALNDFITAYNALNTKLKELTAYDSTNKTASTLTGDSTVRSIQSRLTSLISGTQDGATGTYATLSQIGVSFNKDGSLSLDSTRLDTAIATDANSVMSVVTSAGTNIYAASSDMTLSGGLLSSKTDNLNSMLNSMKERESALTLQLAEIEKRYRKQFSSLDTLISGMTTTSTFLTQLIANSSSQ